MRNRRIEQGEITALSDLVSGLEGLAAGDMVVGTFNIEERLTGRIFARVHRIDKMYHSMYQIEVLEPEQ